jgi:phage-related protein
MQYSADFKTLTGVNDTTIKIQREGKAPVRLDEAQNLIFLSFDIDAPTPITSSSSINGVDGVIDKGTSYGSRAMTARFFMQATDKYDYERQKAKIIRLFDSKDYFKIIDEDRPDVIWEKVKLSDRISFERKSAVLALVTIPMVSFYPYALYTGSLSALADELGYPDSAVTRSFTSTSLSVYNLGDTVIDPRIHDVLITFKGTSSALKIENLTTGDVWQYTESSAVDDEITLDGVFSRKNGFSIFSDTNHEIITLAPGENQIRVSGSSDPFTIQFEFPTYCL